MKSSLVGFFAGILVVVAVGWNVMPSMMINEITSPYNVEKTVAKIQANAIAGDWSVVSIKSLDDVVREKGGGDLPPVVLVNLCQQDHAYNILKNESDRKLSVFMPCTISVYEKNGQTYIGTMNAALLGNMFGGNVADVMGEVAIKQDGFIDFSAD